MGQPQVAFHSVGPVQPCRQPAQAPPHSVGTGTPQAAARSQAGDPSAVHSTPMGLSLGGPPSQTPWMDGGPLSSRLGPHHPPPPPLVPIQPQGDFSYQAGHADTRRDYSPPVSQPSWADQVEYQDRLDKASYQQWLMETGRQPNYLPPPGPSPEPALMLSAGLSSGRLVRGAGKVTDRPIMSPTPTTLVITKGRSTGLMTSHMGRMTTAITIAVFTGRTDAPHHPIDLVTNGVAQ